jgi:hypothetical protein
MANEPQDQKALSMIPILSSGATGTPQPSNRRPSEERWAHFKIITEFSLSLVALAWGILSWLLVQYHEQRTSERQAQVTVEESQSRAKISGAQLATGLMPSLVKGTAAERQAALLVLSSVAPDIARDITNVFDRNAKTPQERQMAQEVNKLSIQAKTNQDFEQHLDNARVYHRFQLFGQADREYIRAASLLPSQLKVDSGRIDEAKSRYAEGNFYEAARIFDEAFGSTSSR